MVRLPRTVRDVLGWVKSPRQILRRGAQFATVAPALTTVERQHVERVLGTGRLALCVVALATLAWDPTWNGSNGQLPVAMLGGYAVFGVLQLAGASRRGVVRLPSHVSHRLDRALPAALTPATLLRHLTVDNYGRPFDLAGRLTLTELEAARRGPLVIKERIREMGGELVIESSADRGVRLDILLRRRLRARSSKTA